MLYVFFVDVYSVALIKVTMCTYAAVECQSPRILQDVKGTYVFTKVGRVARILPKAAAAMVCRTYTPDIPTKQAKINYAITATSGELKEKEAAGSRISLVTAGFRSVPGRDFGESDKNKLTRRDARERERERRQVYKCCRVRMRALDAPSVRRQTCGQTPLRFQPPRTG